MYLVMNDKSIWGTRGGEIKEGILKYLEIPDDLLKQLNYDFIGKFETILRERGYRHIKHRKTKPKIENELSFYICATRERKLVSIFDYCSIWEKDIKKISDYYENNINCPTNVEKKLFLDENDLTKNFANSNENKLNNDLSSIPLNDLINLAKDKNDKVRLSLSNNPSTPSLILSILSLDDLKEIRDNAILNPNYQSVELDDFEW